MKKYVTIAALVSFMFASLGTAFAEEAKAPETAAATEVTTAVEVNATAPVEPAVESDEPTVAEAAYGKAFFGAVKNILPAQKAFVVVHKKNKKVGKFTIDKDTKFFFRGRQVAPKTMRVGDRVVVFVKADKPNKAVRVRIVSGNALGKDKAKKLQEKVRQQVQPQLKPQVQEKFRQQIKDKRQDQVKQEVKNRVQERVQEVKGTLQDKMKDRAKERVQQNLKERAKGKGEKQPGQQ